MSWGDIQIWELLAGLGLFLFGMFMLEEALKVLAGRSFKTFLRRQTGNRVKAVLAGATVTAVLQSSSMVVLLVMSFVGAGIIGLSNGVGMVLGANLGTTMTGWIITIFGFKLEIEKFVFPFMAIGGLGLIFLKSERLSNYSKLLMGFSFMFLGLSFMKEGFEQFVQHFDLTLFVGKPKILFFLAGFFLVAIIQSSSAGIMIFLTSLSSGLITFEQSLFLVIGGDLGTSVTALLGTLKAPTLKRKVGWSQFYINLSNAIIAIPLMGVYVYFIVNILGIEDQLMGMVAFHTVMNLANVMLLLPFIGIFTNLLNKYIKTKEHSIAIFINRTNPKESTSATVALEKEVIRFIEEAIKTNKAFFDLKNGQTSSNSDTMYNNLKLYESELVQFCNLMQQNKLSSNEVASLNNALVSIRYASHSAKDIKDIKHTLIDLRNASFDQFYQYYTEIHHNQDMFYKKILEFLKALETTNNTELNELMTFQNNMLKLETNNIYHLFALNIENEYNISSLLNMAREINDSNREMIRSLSAFINDKEK